MDPFHVVALAGDKLDLCRQRVQQATCGQRGRTGDPLYGVRRTLRTRYPLLSSRQKARLETVFADENHLGVTHCCTAATSPTRSTHSDYGTARLSHRDPGIGGGGGWTAGTSTANGSGRSLRPDPRVPKPTTTPQGCIFHWPQSWAKTSLTSTGIPPTTGPGFDTVLTMRW